MKQIYTFIFGVLLLFVSGGMAYAQGSSEVLPQSRAFDHDETLSYKVAFKWGIINGKIGEATITNKRRRSGQQYFSQLLFRTMGIAESFYSMRDTFETLYSQHRRPLRFEKRILENGYRMTDELTFTHQIGRVAVHTRGYTPEAVQVDTTYWYKSAEVEPIDMLSTLHYVRGLDVKDPGRVNGKRIVIPIARSEVYIECRHQGFAKKKIYTGETVEVAKLTLSIRDEAFASQSDAMQLWVTTDARRLVVLIETRLKIGRAAVELVGYHAPKK